MPREIKWKIHLSSKPEDVYQYLATQEGREKFWAESAEMVKGFIHFIFANGQVYKSKVISAIPFSSFQIEYFDSMVEFKLIPDNNGGTDLIVINSNVLEKEYEENLSGWVSWLMTLKAAIDFQIDLRNHDPDRTWNQGYVDN